MTVKIAKAVKIATVLQIGSKSEYLTMQVGSVIKCRQYRVRPLLIRRKIASLIILTTRCRLTRRMSVRKRYICPAPAKPALALPCQSSLVAYSTLPHSV